MLRVTVLAVGRLRPEGLRAVADDYVTRIRRHVRVEEVEVRAAAALGRRVPPESRLVALEVGGESLTSVEFARYLDGAALEGRGHLTFVLGGADGLPPELSRAAARRISLSRLTLPHRLARVVLFEQLYRSLCILRGEPYAREE